MKNTLSFPGAVRPLVRAALVWVCLVVVAGTPAGAARPPATVSSSSADAVVFRIDLEPHRFTEGRLEGTERLGVRGFSRRGEPGEPAVLAREFLVALPPSGGYRVSARVLESQDLGVRRLEPNPFPAGIESEDLGPLPSYRYEFDADVYNAYADPPLVEPLDPAYIRKQRALPVRVNPVSFNPRSGETILATAIEVTVTFDVPAGRDGGVGRPESPLWRSAFARLFVNAGRASEWRRAPLIQRAAAPPPRALVQGTRVKLHVLETGVHRVSAATAIAGGFPSGRSISDLHLFRRTYDDDTFAPGVNDVAFTVDEDPAGTAGVFDGGDMLVFYAVGLRDDAAQDDAIRKYADYNVYWLGTTSGPTMSTRPVATGFVTADTATASFTASAHYERDVIFNEGSPLGVTDFYYANFGTAPGPIDQAVEVGAIKPGTALSLRAELLGDRYVAPRSIKLSFVNSLGTLVLQPFQPIPNKTRLNYQVQIAGTSVVSGRNTFRVERPDGASRGGVEVLLNWVDISYESLYRARRSTLYFDTALLSGDTSLTVTGIEDTDVWLLDVTDPDAPVRCSIDSGHFVPTDGGRFALSFRETIASRRDYVVIPEAEMIEVTAGDVEADVPSAIIGSPAEGGVDVLVVSHASFVSRMQEWTTYRRAQGYRVLLVDAADVYDEFNNGVPHARAIDRFVRHFFELGDAGALVIVGDSSEDNRTLENGAGPNFVPSHSEVDHVGSLNEDEVVTSDKRYVKLPGPTGVVDRYPDLIVGRIPVGSDAELQRVLAKTFAFEAPRADDFWRKRIVVIGDDAYSEGGSTFGGAQFCYFGIEEDFQGGQERFAEIIENSLPAGYQVIPFYLNDYLDSIHQSNCIGKLIAIDYVRQNVTPLLMNELAQGATLVTIQSHMNRSLVTHEKLLSTEAGSILGGAGRDHLRMENRGRPYVIFGLGCHFSDYAIHKELVRNLPNNPNGDAFAEQLLFANNSAAVGTYGSSGFEYLNETNDLMEKTGEIWFYEAPYDTMVNQTQAQWVFGQLMYLVEVQVAQRQQDAVERYHILGDPLLRIDAGPPAFAVTVNGSDFETGTVVSTGGAADTIRVEAIVTDENAIGDFRLTIDGQDRTGEMTVEQLSDLQLAAGRQYRLAFSHKILPRDYDIVLNAYQAPDTSGDYQMAAEFVLRVESRVTLTVNGRAVESGAVIPSRSDFLVEVALPVYIPGDSIAVSLDETPVSDAVLSHPAPDDSTTWNIRFSRTLTDGTHELIVRAGSANEFRYTLVVSSATGLRHVINYPNPFTDATTFIYTNDVEISDGRIDIYTVSGKRIRRIEIPPDATQPGQNTVHWDGRDQAGGTIANGVYLYVITVTQRGSSTTTRGKLARIE